MAFHLCANGCGSLDLKVVRMLYCRLDRRNDLEPGQETVRRLKARYSGGVAID